MCVCRWNFEESDDHEQPSIDPGLFFRAINNRTIENNVVQANVQQQHASRYALGKHYLRLRLMLPTARI